MTIDADERDVVEGECVSVCVRVSGSLGVCVSGCVVDEGGVCDASHISQIVCCHQMQWTTYMYMYLYCERGTSPACRCSITEDWFVNCSD